MSQHLINLSNIQKLYNIVKAVNFIFFNLEKVPALLLERFITKTLLIVLTHVTSHNSYYKPDFDSKTKNTVLQQILS